MLNQNACGPLKTRLSDASTSAESTIEFNGATSNVNLKKHVQNLFEESRSRIQEKIKRARKTIQKVASNKPNFSIIEEAIKTSNNKLQLQKNQIKKHLADASCNLKKMHTAIRKCKELLEEQQSKVARSEINLFFSTMEDEIHKRCNELEDSLNLKKK